MSTHLLKLAVMGDGGVGKSAITIQFTQNHFVEEYDPTIENSYRKTVEVDGKVILLDVLDTAGQEEYAAMRDQYIRQGKGFLLVYSIDSAHSLSQAEELHRRIQRVREEDEYPVVLLGNKCDLPATQREVTHAQGEEVARRIGAAFLETSAKTRVNVQEGFMTLARKMLKFEAEMTTYENGIRSDQKKKRRKSRLPKVNVANCILL